MSAAVAAPWTDAWSQALDEFELDLAQAELLLTSDHLPSVHEIALARAWHPPTDLGPLPAHLAVRARAVRDRQLDVAQRLAAAMVLNRRHLAAIESMRRPRPPAVPVYLDIEG